MLEWTILGLVGGLLGGVLHRASPRLAGIPHRAGRPFRWPWMELLTAGLFVLLAVRLGFSVATAKWYLYALLLMAMTGTDVLAKLIPDRITFPGAALGILATALFPADVCGFFHHRQLLSSVGLGEGFAGGLALGVAGALAGFLFLEGFRRLMSRLAGMEAMGMGDSKLLMMCGAFLGPELVLFSLLPGVLCGIVFGTVYTRIAGSPHFPFGPALGAGTLLALLFQNAISGLVSGYTEGLARIGPEMHLVLSLAMLLVVAVLLLRIRRRAAEYSRAIEEDYARLDPPAEDSDR